ncbi:uncharacterized protein LOC119887596 [Micropterus salmoides]|uniref:uncharacterized protein LOC119887596 n=1 Tax=Micropterus salmoides TaxID=27706 RepID=UPI0018EAFE3C|nr:uncharacterized protein LOC119887596 [Micropterus salmoides]
MKGLLIQWENPPSVLPVSHFAVQWHPETRPSFSRWTTVDSFTTSTVIQDVDPDESYLIRVIPVYNQQCGPAQSLPASLQQGALMEAINLNVVGVTKTTVTVGWAWRKASGPIRVNRYSVLLKKDTERLTALSLWPDQQQHKLLNLKPNTEYALLLLADNVSRNIIFVRHILMRYQWWPQRLLCCCWLLLCLSSPSCPGLCTSHTSSRSSPTLEQYNRQVADGPKPPENCREKHPEHRGLPGGGHTRGEKPYHCPS